MSRPDEPALPAVERPPDTTLTSTLKASLMALARVMAEVEAKRIMGERHAEMGDLCAAFERPAEP
jgi:hypothetical protein